VTLNSGGGTFDTQANTLTLTGAVADGNASGSLTKTGTGTLTLSGANTYTGATTINGGTLALSGAGNIAASSGVITAAGAVLDISASTGGGAIIQSLGGFGGTVTLGANTLALSNASGMFGGTINGTGGLTLAGGTETLTGNSSAFSGTVNVNSSTLLMGAGATLGNGAAAFNVNNGGTLGGTGRAGGNVAINAGGVLSAGFSPGTLSISGNLVQNAGAISNFELGQAGFVGGASNDLVKVGGNLSMGGTLNLTAATAGWYRLYNVAGNDLRIVGHRQFRRVQQHDLHDDPEPGERAAGRGRSERTILGWRGYGRQRDRQWRHGNVERRAAPTGRRNPAPRLMTSGARASAFLQGRRGTVTVAGAQNLQGLQFTVDGYSLVGGTLNMIGDPFSDPTKSFITTDPGVTATIGSTIAGAGIGPDEAGGLHARAHRGQHLCGRNHHQCRHPGAGRGGKHRELQPGEPRQCGRHVRHCLHHRGCDHHHPQRRGEQPRDAGRAHADDLQRLDHLRRHHPGHGRADAQAAAHRLSLAQTPIPVRRT